ncbi:MAG: glycosyltransferase family 4 protein [Coleofasciculaceae cyanobacterium]
MKVVHVTPTYFDDSSIIGGGERYPMELASLMAEVVDTTLVSFSSKRHSYTQGKLKIEIYPVKYFIHDNKSNPLAFRYLRSVFGVDVIHIHQINTLISDLSCLMASLLNKRTFVTDYGGGGDLVINQKLPVFKGYKNAITYSRFGLDFLPIELQKKSILIKGGIDTNRFYPIPSIQKEKKILYVGRILPHKGINYLIEAFRLLNRSDYQLTIVGRVYNETFYKKLKELAFKLPVEFVHNADDQRLQHEYCSAMVTVLPSVHTDCYDSYTPVPELMGFTLLESQACGTPVICTDAGAMHEFVDEKRTGYVVKQNSPEAIAKALLEIIELPSQTYLGYQNRCCEWIKPLAWSTVIKKHLELYTQS